MSSIHRTLLATFCMASATFVSIPAHAGNTEDIAELTRIVEWARPVTGSYCDFPTFQPDGDILGSNFIHRFKFRYSYETEADPEKDGVLYQLHCASGAYNSVSVFIMKNSYDDLQLLSFAEPTFDIQYEDPDTSTKLKQPPKILGYSANSDLVEGTFDPKTLQIQEYARWRGLGDAWSLGVWKLVDGNFVLKEYTIDPIYNLNAPDANQDTDPDNPADAIKMFP